MTIELRETGLFGRIKKRRVLQPEETVMVHCDVIDGTRFDAGIIRNTTYLRIISPDEVVLVSREEAVGVPELTHEVEINRLRRIEVNRKLSGTPFRRRSLVWIEDTSSS